MIRVSRFRWSLLMSGMSRSGGDVACSRGLRRERREKRKRRRWEKNVVYKRDWKACQDFKKRTSS